MRLLIVGRDGTAHTITAHLEEFDLSRPLARTALVEDILAGMARLVQAEVCLPANGKADDEPEAVEYQTWAVDAEGNLIHCGPRTWRRVAPWVIRRYVNKWERWADKIAREHPDCPTAQSRRRQARVAVQPISGGPVRWFDAKTGAEL
jgi:hypothetical protein